MDTKDTFYCDCWPGYSLATNSTCKDVDECSVAGVCSQECHNSPGSFSCSCLSGYSRDPSNPSLCRVEEGRPAVIFSHGQDIRLSATSSPATTTALVNMTSQAQALVTRRESGSQASLILAFIAGLPLLGQDDILD